VDRVPVRAGDRIPDVEVVDASGDRVALGAFGGEHTLLIFLRHLA
jgi:peroxiredoxin